MWSDFVVVALITLGVVVALMAVTATIGFRAGRHNVVDVSWGLGFALIAAVALLVGDGDVGRRWLLMGVVGVWGLRLAASMWRRTKGKGEDPRYEEMLEDVADRPLQIIRKVYLNQGLAMWFVSLPYQVSSVRPGTVGWMAGAGTLVALAGLAIETVADLQMDRFKQDPANEGKIMDRGLWGWSRHPNYFGDAVVWWGIFIIASEVWPGVLTVLSPVAMTWFLVSVTGADTLERHMEGRPGYAEYKARTSKFILRPPKTVR